MQHTVTLPDVKLCSVMLCNVTNNVHENIPQLTREFFKDLK